MWRARIQFLVANARFLFFLFCIQPPLAEHFSPFCCVMMGIEQAAGEVGGREGERRRGSRLQMFNLACVSNCQAKTIISRLLTGI